MGSLSSVVALFLRRCFGHNLAAAGLLFCASSEPSFEDEEAFKLGGKHLHFLRIILLGNELRQLPETCLFFGRHDGILGPFVSFLDGTKGALVQNEKQRNVTVITKLACHSSWAKLMFH